MTINKNSLTKKKKMELVAPAGGWNQLVAAINAGADAVYLGFKRFSARAFAENFEFLQLKKAVAAAHSSGVKVYLAFNTLIKDSELEEAAGLLNEYFSFCTDGIIIQDLGLYQILSDLFPKIRIHASTQLNIHNLKSLELLKDLNFARTVLAREMTLDEIAAMAPAAGRKPEIEVFAHGSLCYSYSGSCYFSSFTGSRSGNRGSCTQPCRMKYSLLALPTGSKNQDGKGPVNPANMLLKNCHILSKSDLFTLDILPELAKAGVTALKIEGRMKTAEYVGIITALYRKYLNLYYSGCDSYSVSAEDIYKATQIYSRELAHGYYKEEFPKDIVSLKKSGSIGNFLGRITNIEYKNPDNLKSLKSAFNETKNIKSGRSSSYKKYGNQNKSISGNPVSFGNPGNPIKVLFIKSNWPVSVGDILEIWTNAGNEQINVSSAKLLEMVKGKYVYSIDTSAKLKSGIGDRVFKSFDFNLDREAKNYYLAGLKNNPVKVPDVKQLAGTVPVGYFGKKYREGMPDRANGLKISNQAIFPYKGDPGYNASLAAPKAGLKVELYDINFVEKILNTGVKSIVLNNFRQAVNKLDSNPDLVKSICRKCSEKKIDLIIKTPQIIYDKDLPELASGLSKLTAGGINYFSVSNFGVLKTLTGLASGGNNICRDIDRARDINRARYIDTTTDIYGATEIEGATEIGRNPDIEKDNRVEKVPDIGKNTGVGKNKGIYRSINIDINYGFNVFNHKAVSFFSGLSQKYRGINIKAIGLSPELSLSEIRNLIFLSPVNKDSQKPAFNIYSYGYYPVMQSRFKLEYLDENKHGRLPEYSLVDQKNYNFKIVEDYNKNIIFLSSKKICTLFDIAAIISGGISNLYIDTRTFGIDEIIEIAGTYQKALEFYRKNKTKEFEAFLASAKNNRLFSDYTRGHLEREVM